MSNSINWGILGNATIARKCVIPAIFYAANSRVYALASRNPGNAKSLADKYNITRVYDNYESVIHDKQIDIVYIPLPNRLHQEWTIKALEAGKHVLCEKPLACNTAEAVEMAQIAQKKGLHLMEALMYRFHPRSNIIHQMVSKGQIGTPRLVRTSFCFHIEEHILKTKDNARLKKKGGGALLDVGCYGVSLAQWMMGEDPESVQAAAHFNSEDVDVHFVGVLYFGNKGLATVEASFISSLQQTYTVVGEKGSIELPHNAFIPWEKDAAFVHRGRDDEIGRQEIVPGADEYRLMVEHFSDVLIRGSSPLIPVDESIRNIRVLDALAEAARSGQTVVLSEKQI
jgi:D-xylose 1-dehydrogenase (NADP+, D-xylono-1,5-lactone-forming)